MEPVDGGVDVSCLGSVVGLVTSYECVEFPVNELLGKVSVCSVVPSGFTIIVGVGV